MDGSGTIAAVVEEKHQPAGSADISGRAGRQTKGNNSESEGDAK